MADMTQYTDEELMELVDTDIASVLKSRGYKHGWYKEVEYVGYIYILVNPSIKNMVKIGYATDVEKRMKSLYSSAVPDPYHCYAWYKVRHKLEDTTVHNLIDSLDPDLRHSKNREFYDMSPERAYEILSAVAQISGNDDCLVMNPLDDNYFCDDSKPSTKKDNANNSSKQKTTSLPDGKYEFIPCKKKSDNNKIVKANILIRNGEWIIQKGSIIGVFEDKGVSSQAKSLHQKMKIDKKGNLLEDVNLGKASPSAIAAAIMYQSQNGWTAIADKNGTPISEYRSDVN